MRASRLLSHVNTVNDITKKASQPAMLRKQCSCCIRALLSYQDTLVTAIPT